VGNKCDNEEDRIVSTEDGNRLAQRHNMLFFETSAKEGTNVREVFGSISTKILKKLKNNEVY